MAGAVAAVLCLVLSLAPPATAADAVFPIGSRLGFVPPNDLKPATTFPGFENEQKGVFVRLIALPGNAFPEIEKTMTNDALKKQGMRSKNASRCLSAAVPPSLRSCARTPPPDVFANGC